MRFIIKYFWFDFQYFKFVDGSDYHEEEVEEETKPQRLGRYIPSPGEKVRLTHRIQRRNIHPSLVVHTGSDKGRPVKQWETLSQVAWGGKLREFLVDKDRGINEATALQSVLWPGVSRLSSLTAVGPSSQGFTVPRFL